MESPATFKLAHALRAWGSPEFEASLKQELAHAAIHLPLQQGLSSGNYVTDAPLTILINNVADLGNVIRVRIGIFYQSVLGGCSCADDPTPTGENGEYCEVQLEIDKVTAVATAVLVTE
ncbi:MAG: hypothetical protein V4443_07000 [Pseudomonadota bacterium]